MQITAILLRWYRSFNVTALGPTDPEPNQPWNKFRSQSFPFVRVPLDREITTIVGANESGKSHLLSAISKVIKGKGISDSLPDPFEIKDICRYCGFGGLDDGVWPEIGIEIKANPAEQKLFEPSETNGTASNTNPSSADMILTVILNCGQEAHYATVFRGNTVLSIFSNKLWPSFAKKHLPHVEILDSKLALPNEVHIDELIDLYKRLEPTAVVDPLAVQTLWRTVAPIQVVHGGTIDAGTAQRVQEIKTTIESSTRKTVPHEGKLVHMLFSEVLGVTLEHLDRIRKYTTPSAVLWGG